MSTRRIVRPVAAACLLALLAACGGSSSATTTTAAGGGGSEAAAITIGNFSFMPSTLSVPAGTTVTWTNEQGVDHTVTADDSSFDSGPVARGADFMQTFDAGGTYAYHCTIHPSMTASITVTG